MSWLSLFVLTALVAGTAGLPAAAGGATVPAAVRTGGVAFAGTITLLIGLAHFPPDPAGEVDSDTGAQSLGSR